MLHVPSPFTTAGATLRMLPRGAPKASPPHLSEMPKRDVCAAARHVVDYGVGRYDASFFFVSLKANSSISTLSRTTRSTQRSIPASRCSLARNAARAASSPGSDSAARFDRLTRIAASQADPSLACAITSRLIASWSGAVALLFFDAFIGANL